MTRALNGLKALGACREYDSAESLNDYLHTVNPAAEYFPGLLLQN